MFKDLIKYEELHEASPELFMFGEVKFLRTFGLLNEGQELALACFNLEESEFTGYRTLDEIKANLPSITFRFSLTA